jgi:riboflavin kinase/FMN adenylyltransferase
VALVRSLSELPPSARGGALSIGNFDGVHLGHAALMRRVVAHAKQLSGAAIALTFDPHPSALLRPESVVAPLTTVERKEELLAALGVDYTIAYPTDWALLKLTAEEFFQRFVVEGLDSKVLVEGADFRFGAKRQGDIALLGEFCKQTRRTLDVVDAEVAEGETVSSSRVRDLVRAGRLGVARTLLTAPYRVRGTVVLGAERGRKLGFPTANLEQIDTVSPGVGVYAGRAYVDGKRWPAAIHVGPNPTFGEEAVKIEVHLIDFEGNLYGKEIAVEFLDRLRDVQKFPGVHDLLAQLRLDVAESKDLSECGGGP